MAMAASSTDLAKRVQSEHAAEWAINRTMCLRRGGPVWSRVHEFLRESVRTGRLRLRSLPRGSDLVFLTPGERTAAWITVVGYDAAKPPQLLRVPRATAHSMWNGILHEVSRSLPPDSLEGDVVLALQEGNRVVRAWTSSLQLVEDVTGRLYNVDLVAEAGERALGMAARRHKRDEPSSPVPEWWTTISRKRKAGDQSSSSSSEEEEEESSSEDEEDDDFAHVFLGSLQGAEKTVRRVWGMEWRTLNIPVHANHWKILRGTLITAFFCAAQIETFKWKQRRELEESTWQTAVATQQEYEKAVCEATDENTKMPAAQLLRILCNSTVHSGGHPVAVARIRQVLGGLDAALAERISLDMWGAPAVVAAFHCRPTARAAQTAFLHCVASPTVAAAIRLAADFRLPGQLRALGLLETLETHADRWVSVLPGSNEPRRPTPLQLGATVRSVFPAAREGVDFFIVWSLTSFSPLSGGEEKPPFALVIRESMWGELGVAEGLRRRCTLESTRWSMTTMMLVGGVLHRYPGHAMDALRLLFGGPLKGGPRYASMENGEVLDAMNRVERVVRAIPERPTMGALVALLWDVRGRGAHPFWVALETALCPRAAVVQLIRPVGAGIPAWADRAVWTAFNDRTPDPDSPAWEEVIRRNLVRSAPGTPSVFHPVPAHLTDATSTAPRSIFTSASFFGGGGEQTRRRGGGEGALAVEGVPVRTDAAKLVPDGILTSAPEKVCMERFEGNLHFHMLDALLAAAEKPGGRAEALEWFARIRVRPTPSAVPGTVRLPFNVVAPAVPPLADPPAGLARPTDEEIDGILEGAEIRLRDFLRVLPAVMGSSSLDQARRRACEVVRAKPPEISSTASAEGILPVRAAEVVGTLPEVSDHGTHGTWREHLVAPREAWLPRPLGQALPGILETVLANFFWPTLPSCIKQ